MSTGRSRFRAFYKEFVIVPIEESFRPLLEGFPGYQGAPYALVYGYVDPARGFMVEVVAYAEKGGGDFRFRNSTHKKKVHL